MRTKVTFSRKNELGPEDDVNGRIYFIGDREDDDDAGEIYLDGKRFGETVNRKYVQTTETVQGNMGYLVLKKNQDFKTQVEGVSEGNTIFEIRYDYDLGGQTVTIPGNCVLKFEWGSISNGTVVGNNSTIKSDSVKILGDIEISGTWIQDITYTAWGDGDKWINSAFNLSKYRTLVFDGRTYDLKYAQEIKTRKVVGNGSTITINSVVGSIGLSNYFVFGHVSDDTSSVGHRIDITMENLTITSSSFNGYLLEFKYVNDVTLRNMKIIFNNKNDLATVAHCLDFSGCVNNILIEECSIENYNLELYDKGSTLWFRNIPTAISPIGYNNITISRCYIFNNAVDELISFGQGGTGNFHGSVIINENTFVADNTDYTNEVDKTSFIINGEGFSAGTSKVYITDNKIVCKNCIPTSVIQIDTDPCVISGNIIDASGKFVNTAEHVNYGRTLIKGNADTIISGNIINITCTKYAVADGSVTMTGEYGIATNAKVLNNTITVDAPSANFYISGSECVGNYITFAKKGAIRVTNVRNNYVKFLDSTAGNIMYWNSNKSIDTVYDISSNYFDFNGNIFGGNIQSHSYVLIHNNVFINVQRNFQGNVYWGEDNLFFGGQGLAGSTTTSNKESVALTTFRQKGIRVFDIANSANMNVYYDGSKYINDDGVDMTSVTSIKGITSTREAMTLSSANAGLKYYDTTLKKYVLWNGTAWTNLDGTALS